MAPGMGRQNGGLILRVEAGIYDTGRTTGHQLVRKSRVLWSALAHRNRVSVCRKSHRVRRTAKAFRGDGRRERREETSRLTTRVQRRPRPSPPVQTSHGMTVQKCHPLARRSQKPRHRIGSHAMGACTPVSPRGVLGLAPFNPFKEPGTHPSDPAKCRIHAGRCMYGPHTTMVGPLARDLRPAGLW
jgi:hypothetical protein